MKTLRENIELKLEEILDQINTNKITKETISKLELLVKDILDNTENLEKFEIEEYVDKIYKNNNGVDKDKIKSKLNTLKKIAMAKSKTGESIFDFDKEQIEYIKNFCIDAIAFIKASKETLLNNADLDNYKQLLNKIQNHEKLSSNDLPLIIEMFKDKSKEELQSNLMEFYRYNLEVEKLKKIQELKEENQSELEKEEHDKELVVNEEIIKKNIDKIVKTIKRNETHNEKSINKVIKDYNTEIGSKINLGNATEVLEILEKLNIYHKFGTEELFVLMIYGTQASIQEAYEEFNNPENIMHGNNVIYKFPSLWVKQKKEERKSRKRINNKKNEGKTTTITLRSKAILMNREELYEKIEFYKTEGFDIIAADKENCQRALTPSLETIKAKAEDFKLYDIKPQLSSYAIISNVKKSCDEMIECNLLMPFSEDNNSRSRYANNYPTFIGLHKDGHVLIAESLLATEDENEIFSKTRESLLSNDFKKQMKIKNATHNLEEYQKSKNMVITNEFNLDRYKEMEDISINASFDSNLINNEIDFIKELDEKYKENDYRYRINASIISRLKVIRCYNALQKYNETLDNENKIDEKNIRFFSMTYGTYIKKETYEQIKNEVYERGSRIR